jgi:dolichol-phosphate mannosyltransferase
MSLTKKSNVEISIVVPVYNESSTLSKSLLEIRRYVQSTGLSYEIIVVDDGSGDGTWDILRTISHEDQTISAIRLSRNFGKESAISAALECATGEAVIVMDSDLQHPPEIIPDMISRWREGFDIVEAVKAERGKEKFSLKIGARLFYWLMMHLTDLDLDNSSDFKLLDRRVVDAHNRLPEGSRFFRGIVSWLGFTKTQVPFSVRERISGSSKWSAFRLVKLAVHASTSFSSLPLHIVTALGFLTLLISIILGFQTLYMKFSGSAVSGFTTVILLLLLIGSIIMVSLGIIGIYISKIFDEVKGRPKFIVKETIHLRK